MSVLLADRLVPVFPAPVAYGRQCTSVTFLCRHLPHHVLALPRLSPYVAEAEKGERGTIRARVAGRIWSIAAEVDEACLVGMERELVPSKTLAQYIQNPLGILEVRERPFGVVAAEYAQNLETNLSDLLERIMSGRYQAHRQIRQT